VRIIGWIKVVGHALLAVYEFLFHGRRILAMNSSTKRIAARLSVFFLCLVASFPGRAQEASAIRQKADASAALFAGPGRIFELQVSEEGIASLRRKPRENVAAALTVTFLARHFGKKSGNLYDAPLGKDVTDDLELDSGEEPADYRDLKALRAAIAEPDLAKRLAMFAIPSQQERLRDMMLRMQRDTFTPARISESFAPHQERLKRLLEQGPAEEAKRVSSFANMVRDRALARSTTIAGLLGLEAVGAKNP
jgi:hypothetical protein